MKKLIASSALILFITVCFGQTYNFTGYDFKQKGTSRDYPYYWDRCNVPIDIDIDHDKIYVDSYYPGSYYLQTYEVIEHLGTSYGSDGSKIYKFQCVDSRGLKCIAQYQDFLDGVYHLYIEYSDIQWVYEMD